MRGTWLAKDYGQRFWSKVKMSDHAGGCFEWTAFRDIDGYGRFQISKKVCRFAHRVAWEMSKGEIEGGMCVLHTCDNPSCVRVDHLFLGTRLDNNRDRVAKGRNGIRRQLFGDDNPSRKRRECMCRGEGHSRSKITEDTVRKIRSSVGTSRALAQELSLSESHVGRIRSGKLWTHVI